MLACKILPLAEEVSGNCYSAFAFDKPYYMRYGMLLWNLYQPNFDRFTDRRFCYFWGTVKLFESPGRAWSLPL